ncbi:MAG: hypothetical protein ACFFD2_11330 [Promethearchaeota archaeon]
MKKLMEKNKSEVNWIERVYNKLTDPKTIKVCGYTAIIVFFGLFLTAVLIAIVSTNYNIISNWISDLGSFDYTPTPYLFDSWCIITGPLIIPLIFYLEKNIAPIPQKAEDLPAPHRWIYRLSGLDFFFNILGCISFVLIGIFSEDRSFGLHYPISYLTFGSFAFGALFMGLTIFIAQQDIIPKPFNYILGVYGIIAPFSVGILTVFNEIPFMEWMTFISVLVWLLFLTFFTLRHASLVIRHK